MRKFRTLLAAIAAGAAIAAQACWFGDNNTSGLEDAYLAYLSGDVKHVEKGEGEGSYTIKNGQTVALPFTVFVKVSPHKHNGDTSEGDSSNGDGKITKAVLQYAIVNGSSEAKTAATISEESKLTWITVKEIDNPDWEMNFEDPVALFGRDCIDIPNVTEQKEVIIRLYLSDGTYSTGQLEDSDGSSGGENGNGFNNIQDSITVNGSTGGGSNGDSNSNFTYSNGWTAPFVWKVKVLPNASKIEGGSNGKPSRRPHR